MNNNDSIHSMLSTKLAGFLSWLSAFMGLGTFMGLVNTLIGVMSACYLAIQLWNYFTHARKKNRLELEVLQQKLDATSTDVVK